MGNRRIGTLLFCLIMAIAPSSSASVRSEIIKDLRSRKGTQFEPLISRWQKAHGTQSVAPLLALAQDGKRADAERYVALMASAKIGGQGAAIQIVPFLRDRSWMIRCAALRILRALKEPSTGTATLALLKDRALVVRSEAVTTVRELRPAGAEAALAEAMLDPANYHGGRALWVPTEAATALIELAHLQPAIQGVLATRIDSKPQTAPIDHSIQSAPERSPLPAHWRNVLLAFSRAIDLAAKDPRFLAHTVASLEKLTARTTPSTAKSLAQRAAWWKNALLAQTE